MIASSSLLRHRHFTASTRSYLSAIEATREGRNKAVRHAYNAYTPPKEKTKSGKKAQPMRPDGPLTRERHPTSRLGIHDLFHNQPLADLFQCLIAHCYRGANFYYDGFEKELYAHLRRGKHPLTSMADLMPEAAHWQQIFLLMLRGTRHYNIDTGEGYPPLEMVCSIEEQEAPIEVRSAPLFLLKLALGSDRLQTLLERERLNRIEGKRRRDTVTAAQLTAILRDLSPEERTLFAVGKHFPKQHSVTIDAGGVRDTTPVPQCAEEEA